MEQEEAAGFLEAAQEAEAAAAAAADEPSAYELVREVSNRLGVVPECINCFLPDDLHQSGVGDHQLVPDWEGQPWMSVSSYPKFVKSCNLLQTKRLLKKGSVLWVAIMPHMSLRDAYLMDNLVKDYEGMNPATKKPKAKVVVDQNGVCHGIPFLVKNQDLLDSKVKEYQAFIWLSRDAKRMSADLGNQLWDMRNKFRYGFYMGDTEETLEELGYSDRCETKKEHLILAMYARRASDISDLHDRFSPHEAILKLLPKLHDAIYVGPDRYVESDEQKQQTEISVIEDMQKLRAANPAFQMRTSIFQQACRVLGEQAEYRKVHELVRSLGKMRTAVNALETEFNLVTDHLDQICGVPTLVGNTGSGPEWMEKEDDDASDVDDPYEVYEDQLGFPYGVNDGD